MNPTHDQDESLRRLATAAVWRVRLTDSGLESSSEFEAWLAEDAGNEAAWREVSGQWELLGEQAASPAVMQLRREVLERAAAVRSTHATAHEQSRMRWLAALAAGVIVALAGTIWFVLKPGEYRTAFGERRVVTLQDGSRISLDSDTAVQVRYSNNARRLRLLGGQARFDVAHAAQRPFSVEAGDHTVTATGTSFNVDLRKSEVVVTLIEGHVTVASRNPSVKEAQPAQTKAVALHLDAGETLTAAIDTPAPPRVEKASLETVTSWESGRLIFDNETLEEAVQRVARYSRHPIIVADEGAAKLRLSGVFNAGDVDTFVDTVARYLPVRAAANPDGSIVLSSRSERS